MKNISFSSTESSEQGRYHIFTVNKTATYSIYGWVKFSDITDEEVTLEQTLKKDNRIIQNKNNREGEVFFLKKTIKMVRGTRISLYFKSTYTDSLFLVYELRNQTVCM